MGKRGAWDETTRLRTVGARVLVDAALEERIPIYIHESVVFVYADGGATWLDEDAHTDDGGSEILKATLLGEREAVRFTQAGGRGIVLRFGGFYGPDAPSTVETAQMGRRRMLPQVGAGANYMSSIYVPDAGRAVAAALRVPAGTYNICDDTPVPFADYLRAAADALGAPRPRRLPAVLGRFIFGELGRYIFRSLRVSNRRFRETAGWAPEVTSVSEGWPRIAAEWSVPAPVGVLS
jgi:nucleoside-diphosphate-sugar epimerase